MKKILFILFILLSVKGFSQSGITWNPTADIAANAYGNMHPRIVMDRAGNPMVIWGKMGDKSVYFSKWNGTMFTTPLKLNPAWLEIATASWMGPDIASHGDTVYVVVKRVPESADTNYTYLLKSLNGGQTWNAPVRIDNISDSVSRFPTVTTDNAGNPIVAFMKFNASFLDSRWVVAKSINFGNSFGTDIKASGWGASAEVCDCCPGSVISSGNNTVVLYRDNNANIRDVWMGVSSNNMVSFTNGCNVDNNNWMLMMCPSSGPDGFIKGDTVYSVFMNGGSGSNRNYYSKASLSGVAVGQVANLGANIPGLSDQNFPRIDNYNSAAAIVWKQTLSGSVQLPILFTKNISNGFPALYDTVDIGNITNTDVALSNGKVFVVWQDDASGTVKYRSGTYTPIAAGVSFAEEPIFVEAIPNPSGNVWNIKGVCEEAVHSAELYDLYGKILFATHPQKTNFSFTIDNQNLPVGNYFLKVSAKNSFKTIHLMKN